MVKRFLILMGVLATLLVMAVSGVVLVLSQTAGASAHASTATTTCNPTGALVVDVTYIVKNDADSGTAGNTWALDTFNRGVQVRHEVDGSYCATVTDSGTIVTVSGNSPGASYDIGGTVADGVTGTIVGGYIETFKGTLRSIPLNNLSPTGNLGTFDYNCDTTSQPKCPGRFDWLKTYFSVKEESTAMPQWGWTYHTDCNDANGNWVNALAGNAGDITGVPTTCPTPTPVPPTATPVPPTPTPVPPVTPKLPKTGSDPLA